MSNTNNDAENSISNTPQRNKANNTAYVYNKIIGKKINID
jgi:hypothetical protein